MGLIVIEPANAEALEDFEFTINDIAVQSQITAIIEDYMQGFKAKGGCYDFYVVCDGTNNSSSMTDNHELECYIFVKPTISMEFIKLSVIVVRTGADFTTALQLVG